jgi:hypothetical protein
MAYTKYSLTPASNTAAPPDGAPEGMLPSAVNDTMRDMMSQIRDCGDGIRGGTYTMTAPVITGGSITGVTFTSIVVTGGSITGITDLAVADGGTGASTAANARTNLSAAASGANSDITSLTGLTTPLSVAQGGTGSTAAGPAFSAYCSTGTSLAANTFTKQDLQTEEFDTNSNFATSRFTPTVAGYYQINAGFSTGTSGNSVFIAIFKNGSNHKQGNLFTTVSGVGGLPVVSSIVYCNGSTDYIEMFVLSSTAATTNTGSNTTYMNGCFLRGA